MATDPRVFLKLVATLYSIPNALERLLAYDHWQPELDEDLRNLANILSDHIAQAKALPNFIDQWQRSEQLIRAALARRAINRITSRPIVTTPLDEVIEKAATIFGSEEAARAWMQSPALALEGRTPAFLITTEGGAQLVSDLLVRLEYGVYA